MYLAVYKEENSLLAIIISLYTDRFNHQILHLTYFPKEVDVKLSDHCQIRSDQDHNTSYFKSCELFRVNKYLWFCCFKMEIEIERRVNDEKAREVCQVWIKCRVYYNYGWMMESKDDDDEYNY